MPNNVIMGYECLLAGLPDLKAGGEKAPHGTTSSVGDPAEAMKIGFVRVNRFGENTYNEFIAALTALKGQGATAYGISRVRHNSVAKQSPLP